ncbi:hypothetical protein CEXT_359751 [Caerostris extrusa]|uniref:Uncharacterized protein n=1 Tax=Caerostris extrusa TaxID=172846 RepID=A0AAV4P4V6_CAEEX|nr:hypothetical protein CEXT_359751 [Caerostris extrusa]
MRPYGVRVCLAFLVHTKRGDIQLPQLIGIASDWYETLWSEGVLLVFRYIPEDYFPFYEHGNKRNLEATY